MKLKRKILIVVLLLFKVYPAYGDNFTLNDLLAGLSQVEHFKAAFVETKQFLFLDVSVVNEGTIEYKNTEFIEMVTLSPIKELVTLDGNKMYITKRDAVGKNQDKIKRQVISLEDYPDLNLAFNDVYSFLNGNLGTLKERYTFEIAGTKQQWTLKITPLLEKLAKRFESIDIRGHDLVVSSVFMNKGGNEDISMQLEYEVLTVK